ncbi:MAG: molybdenum cofactor cytidylyltransferase [Pseudohongiellaceae bacterium]|jgi:molybdenum cofactor cytidylyltransferase
MISPQLATLLRHSWRQNLLAIVLAAGRGRRVGGPKALLDLGGITALQRVLNALRAGGLEHIRVVLGAEAARVEASVKLEGVELAYTEDIDWGQSASLKAGLALAPVMGPGFAVHPVDVALVDGESVAQLHSAFAARAPGIDIVVPSVDGRRGHPAFFAAPLAAEFAALGLDEPAHRIVRKTAARVHHVVLQRPWLIRDLDLPEDVEAARIALDPSSTR